MEPVSSTTSTVEPSTITEPTTTPTTGTTEPTTGTTEAGATSQTAEASTVAGASGANELATVSTVYNSVNMMLGSMDSGVAGNDLLKMIITLMILNVLLGKDTGQSTDPMSMLAAGIMSGSGSGSGSGGMSLLYMESSTTTVSVEQTACAQTAQQAYEAGSQEPTTESTQSGSVNELA